MALKERLQESIRREAVTEMSAFSGFRDRNKQMIKEEIGMFKTEILNELKRIMEEKIGEDGITTIKGDRGYTPQKGVDFFTSQEIEQIKKELRPIKGKDYNDGRPGKNGYIPKLPNIERIIEEKLSRIKFPETNIEELVKKINDKLDYHRLKNLPFIPKERLGGGGGGVNIATPAGTVDGSNAVFTTVNGQPKYILVDGVAKFETTHYTYSGSVLGSGTITITDGAPPVQNIRMIV